MFIRIHSFVNGRSLYFKNIVTLITGTTLSQLIPLLITPLLTRLYSPEDFGLLTMALGAANLLSIIYTAKYEAALIVPEEEKLASHLLQAILFVTLAAFLFSELILVFLGSTILNLINLGNIPFWLLFFVPFLALVQALNLVFQNWNVRQAKFKLFSYNKFIESGSYASSSLLLGFLNIGSGLIFGRLMGQLSAVIFQYAKLFGKPNAYTLPSLNDLLFPLKKFKKFAIYFMPGSLLNKASVDLNFILFGVYFDNATVGFIGLINRIASAPTFFIATSVGNAFRKQAMDEIHETGNCYKTYKKTFLILISLAIIPFSTLFFFAPTLFSFFFGNNWSEAGKFMQVLTPFYFLQFITSPLSSIFLILEKQEINFGWQAALALSTVTAVVVGGMNDSVYLALISYSVTYAFLYLINLYLTFSLAKRTTISKKHIGEAFDSK